jgi:hypothetical protein
MFLSLRAGNSILILQAALDVHWLVRGENVKQVVKALDTKQAATAQCDAALTA